MKSPYVGARSDNTHTGSARGLGRFRLLFSADTSAVKKKTIDFIRLDIRRIRFRRGWSYRFLNNIHAYTRIDLNTTIIIVRYRCRKSSRDDAYITVFRRKLYV